ncbi:MAG TPA: hypothetical protein DCF96_00850, partial [Rhodobacteraceae bacterium]|nr:hypothetical protein [Paracoccaceae bacterium]
MKFGTPQTRDEDATLVQGKGSYVGDRDPAGTLWMHVIRSDNASGLIKAIKTSHAEAMPGVRLIITSKVIEDAGIK